MMCICDKVYDSWRLWAKANCPEHGVTLAGLQPIENQKKPISIPAVPENVNLQGLQIFEEGPMADESIGGNQFVVKDSGERKKFASGMVRDTAEGKIDYTRWLTGPMFDRYAAHLSKAATKYPDIAPGVPNWSLAQGEEELEHAKRSLLRHAIQLLRGERDEDHAAAAMFNINLIEFVREKMQQKENR